MRRSRLLQAAIVLTIVGCDPHRSLGTGTEAVPPLLTVPSGPLPVASLSPTPAMPIYLPAASAPPTPRPPVPTHGTNSMASPTIMPDASPTPTATPFVGASPESSANPTPSPPPRPTATPAPSPVPTPQPNGRGMSQYDADLATAPAGGELQDWKDVNGPAWLDHSAWTVKDGVWQMPAFASSHYAFRRYAGDAFGGDGGMPDLYQVTVRIRPTGPDGTIAVCPYYLSPTQYCLVLLDRKAKTVSLWEMNGATPTGGTQGTYDLSQNHRGWQPLPAPDADGAYTIRTKVNAQWHSLAIWIGSTWIDTPKVDSVTSQPHYVAIRTSGQPQAVVGIGITTYTDPNQAR